MRILLMNPIRLYWRWPTSPDATMMLANAAPLTLAQLAAAVPGHEVRLLDGHLRSAGRAELSELVRWADLVGINVMSSYAALNTELNLRFIKAVDPSTRVIIGGHHATFNRDEWLSRGADFVIRNEGEQTLSDLLDTLAKSGDPSSVPGLSFVEDGEVRHNRDRQQRADLDTLPMPAWDLLDLSPYRLFLRRRGYAAAIESSRGCTHACQFCQGSAMWAHRQRFKSPSRFVAELEDLHGRGIRQVFVIDDSFGAIEDRERVKEIFRLWRRSGIELEWGTSFRVDSVVANQDLVEEAVELGMRFSLVGFESLSQRWVNTYGKDYAGGLGVEAYQEVYEIFRRNGVLVGGFLVIGYPGQTLDDVRESLTRFRTICDVPIVTVYKPLKGTAGYRRCERDGLLTKDMFYHDSQISPVKGAEEILAFYNSVFAKMQIHPRNLRALLFPPHEGYAAMLRANYRWFLRGLLDLNRHNVADFIGFLRHRGATPQEQMDRLTARYLDDDFVQALAAPFTRGRLADQT